MGDVTAVPTFGNRHRYAFYRDVLGFTLVQRHPGTGDGWYVVERNGFRIWLGEAVDGHPIVFGAEVGRSRRRRVIISVTVRSDQCDRRTVTVETSDTRIVTGRDHVRNQVKWKRDVTAVTSRFMQTASLVLETSSLSRGFSGVD